jgi:hypothetical protein
VKKLLLRNSKKLKPDCLIQQIIQSESSKEGYGLQRAVLPMLMFKKWKKDLEWNGRGLFDGNFPIF